MKRISRSLTYSAAALFSLAAVAVGAPHQKQPFTLTLAAPEQPLEAGQPLLLRVTITNTSDRAVRIPIGEGVPGNGKVYQAHVLDERGRPAPPWVPPPPKGVRRIRMGSLKGAQLQPGESLTDEVDVTHVYDLSRPGKYKVWITEPFYQGPHLRNGLIRSNTVGVTVVKTM